MGARARRVGLILLASLSAVVPAGAYSVQPMIYTLTPGGSGATVRLAINNTRPDILNIEIQPFQVTADDTGKRTFTPAPDDFLLFPPQASVAGDHTQVVQARYVGPSGLTQGRVYVLRVHQTNTVDVTTAVAAGAAGSQGKLGLALNFNTTAIVQPKALTPDVVVERDLAPDASGVLHARLSNRGNGVADLTRLGWTLDRGGKSEPLALQDVRYGEAVFLEAGHSRDIALDGKIKAPAALVLKAASDGGKAN